MIYIFCIPGTQLRWAVSASSEHLAKKEVGEVWRLLSALPVKDLSITYTETKKAFVEPLNN